MASTIVVPTGSDIGSFSAEVATGFARDGSYDGRVANALIAIATAAVNDIDELQASAAAAANDISELQSNGAGGPGATTIWVVDSSVASSAYASGLRYVPLRDAQTDYIAFQLVSGKTGTLSVTVYYAMSSASAADVRLRADRFILESGEDPSAALTQGTAFTLSASNDVLDHSLTSSSSADFAFSVTAGDRVVWKLNRLGSDGADTHAGDMRINNIRVL